MPQKPHSNDAPEGYTSNAFLRDKYSKLKNRGYSITPDGRRVRDINSVFEERSFEEMIRWASKHGDLTTGAGDINQNAVPLVEDRRKLKDTTPTLPPQAKR